eukprot:Opistho-2@89355
MWNSLDSDSQTPMWPPTAQDASVDPAMFLSGGMGTMFEQEELYDPFADLYNAPQADILASSVPQSPDFELAKLQAQATFMHHEQLARINAKAAALHTPLLSVAPAASVSSGGNGGGGGKVATGSRASAKESSKPYGTKKSHKSSTKHSVNTPVPGIAVAPAVHGLGSHLMAHAHQTQAHSQLHHTHQNQQQQQQQQQQQ